LIDQVSVSGSVAQAADSFCANRIHRGTPATDSATNPVTGAEESESDPTAFTTCIGSQTIIDCAPDGILVTDCSNHIRFMNRAMITMFKLEAETALGKWAHSLLSEGCAQLVESEFQNFWGNGYCDNGVFCEGRKLTGQRSDDTKFPVHFTSRAVQQGGELLITSFVRDISTQVEVEDEFQRQNAHLKATIDYSPIGICMINKTFDLLEVNLAFAKMVGHPVGDFVGRKFTEFAHPEDIDKIENAACQNFLEKRDHYTLRCRYVHKNGRTVHAAITIGLIRDAFGSPEYAIANIQDLTHGIAAQMQLKEQQNQLNHLERLSMLGEMSAGIVHEIDQPLTAISNYAQSAIRFLSANGAKPERAVDALRHLGREAQRAGAVVRRVRDLARRRPCENKLIDCSALIDDVEELLRFDARSHQVAIRMVLSRKLPKVLGDPIQLQQVVLNLVRNALDTSRETSRNTTPEITVCTATWDNGDVLVAVSDEGAGVDSAIATNLFQPFSTDKRTGIGLGLSISQSIVTAHGGQLAFRNNRADGATFYFTLPPAPEH